MTRRRYVSEIAKLMRANSGRHQLYRVFSDAVEMMAIAISNAVDRSQAEAREARYLEIIRHYDEKQRARFAEILARLTEALEFEPGDVLGAVFGELEQGNRDAGQFFTPYEVCRFMARLNVGDGEDIRARIRERGFVTVHEPAAGSGAMIIAMAEAMHEAGINYQRHMHVTAIDIDERAVHMAYVQLSLLYVPALIYVGDSISMNLRGVWRTPAHILGGWDAKLRRGYALGSESDPAVASVRESIALPSRQPVQLDLFAAPA